MLGVPIGYGVQYNMGYDKMKNKEYSMSRLGQGGEKLSHLTKKGIRVFVIGVKSNDDSIVRDPYHPSALERV